MSATTRADLETDTRVSVLESQFEIISTSVEKLETKIDTNYATLHHRISELRDDVRGDIDVKHEKLIEKLEEQSQSSSDQHKAIAEKLAQMEKWKYMMVGGASVLGYIFAHLKLEKLF